MIFIEINEKFRNQISRSLIVQTAGIALVHQSIPQQDTLSIVITDDNQIHELNYQYRRVDSPTDVLSFPGGYLDPENDSTYLGDVIISFPRAQAQAEERGHTTQEEIQLLIIHGILHLFGFDHENHDDKTIMWAAQDEILEKLNLSIDIPK